MAPKRRNNNSKPATTSVSEDGTTTTTTVQQEKVTVAAEAQKELKKATEGIFKTESDFITSFEKDPNFAANKKGTTTTKTTTTKTTTTTTSVKPTPAASTDSSPSSATADPIKYKKPTALQNGIYFTLVILSVISLLWLVYVSMQPISFTPCSLLNGTWFVSHEHGALSPLLVGKYAKSSVGFGGADIEKITDFVFGGAVGGEEQQPNSIVAAETQEMLEQKRQQIVQIDLSEFIDYDSNNDTLLMPEGANPMNIAPKYVEPITINYFSKVYHGGAKMLWWNGECKDKLRSTSSSTNSKCLLKLLRGHWTLTVFPGDYGAFISQQQQNEEKKDANENQIPSPFSAFEPYTVMATRLDANEVAEEAVFNKKVKYVLILMAVVGVIHYLLSFFQPPTAKKIRRDVALQRLLDLEKQKQAFAAASKKTE